MSDNSATEAFHECLCRVQQPWDFWLSVSLYLTGVLIAPSPSNLAFFDQWLPHTATLEFSLWHLASGRNGKMEVETKTCLERGCWTGRLCVLHLHKWTENVSKSLHGADVVVHWNTPWQLYNRHGFLQFFGGFFCAFKSTFLDQEFGDDC